MWNRFSLAAVRHRRLTQPFMSATPRALILLAALALASGCSVIYKTTGDILVGYGRSEMTPYLLKMDDVDMACATGSAFTPFLSSFERVHSSPERLTVLTYSLAAACAQDQAREQKLRYMRAADAGRAAKAQDARIMEKRRSRLAAARLQQSWQHMRNTYGRVGEDRCPRLRTDFDELVFLVGWLNGVQAMLYDAASGGQQGVSRSLAGKARHAAGCLDNAKWWGVPAALRASVEVILPALAENNERPWSVLERSVQQGRDDGVRLSSALYIMAAHSVDKRERVREGIRGFARHDKELNEDYRMLDAMAAFMVRGVSDELWTQATGKRTPMGSLGRLPGDNDDNGADIEGLL